MFCRCNNLECNNDCADVGGEVCIICEKVFCNKCIKEHKKKCDRKKITLKFKQKHKNNPDWFVFDTKINGTPFRVKIKKDETGKKIVGDKEYLNNFLRTKLYQEIMVEV